VYLFVLEVSEESDKIHRMGLASEEDKNMFRNAPANVPQNVMLLPSTNNSFEAAFERHPNNKVEQEWVLT